MIKAVLQQFLDNSVNLYQRYDYALTAPNYDLVNLAELEQRLEAALEGVVIAKADGWELCHALLFQESELQESEPKEIDQIRAADIFVASQVTLRLNNPNWFEKLLPIASSSQPFLNSLIRSVLWLPHRYDFLTQVNQWSDDSIHYKLLALGISHLQRSTATDLFQEAIACNHPIALSLALQSLGTQKCEDQLSTLLNYSKDANSDVKFWAIWSAYCVSYTDAPQNEEHQKSIELLFSILTEEVTASTDYSLPALLAVMNRLSLCDSMEWLKSIGNNPENILSVIIATGISGDPVYLPTLIHFLEDKFTARVAGEALSFITGLDLSDMELAREDINKLPSKFDLDTSVYWEKYQQDLPWLDAKKVREALNLTLLESGTRYLLGQKYCIDHSVHVLKTGTQRQRQQAAHYLFAKIKQQRLFPVDSSTQYQLKLLEGVI